MHGYFIDKRLYDKVRALAKPDEWKEYRKERIRQKLEEKAASRISIAKVPLVLSSNLVLPLLNFSHFRSYPR